jgi:MBG domain-containing protein/VCBS repeat protein
MIAFAPASQAQCVANSRLGAMMSDLATLEPEIDTVNQNLDRYAIIFRDIALTDRSSGAPVHPCDTADLRAAFTVRLKQQSVKGFHGFLHGGSASFAYATGAMLLARGELTPEMNALLLATNYDPSITPFCGHVGDRFDNQGHVIGKNWMFGDDCMDDYSVAVEGYAWREAFFKLSNAPKSERDQAINYLDRFLFDTKKSFCLTDGDPNHFTDDAGPCNSDVAHLNDTSADSGTVLIPLNHGMEDANYGIGLVSTLANAYLALEIAGEAVNGADYHGIDGFPGSAADALKVYKALWLQGQRSAGPEPNSDDLLRAWAPDKCYRPSPDGTLLEKADFDQRDRPCFDQGNGGYRITTYPVQVFYDQYVAHGYQGNPNQFQFTAGDFPVSKFKKPDGRFDEPLGFFGVARFEIYYTLSHLWLADHSVRPEFASRIPGDCSTFPTPQATITASRIDIHQGEVANIPVTLSGPGPWDLVWSDGHEDKDVYTSSFIRPVTPTVDTVYSIVSVNGATCPGSAVGSITVGFKKSLLFVDDVIVNAGVPKRFHARLSSAEGPVANARLIFTVLGVEIGRAVTDANGDASVVRAIDAPPGVYPHDIVVTFETDPAAEPGTGTLTVLCDTAAFTVRPDTLNVTKDGVVNFPFVVTTPGGCPWTATPAPGSESFVTVSDVDVDRGTFRVTVAASDGTPRDGAVIVGPRRIAIHQGGAVCNFNFVPELSFLSDESGQLPNPSDPAHPLLALTPITISAPPNCNWTVDPDPNATWLHFDPNSPLTGTGSGTIRVWANENNDGARTATLSIHDGFTSTGKPATGRVNQAAKPPCKPVEMIADAEGGRTLTNSNQDVSVAVAASGTRIQYFWQVFDDEGFPVLSFLGSNQAIFRSGNPGYPPNGHSYTYRVNVSNECSPGFVSRTVRFTSSYNECPGPFILQHPGTINSPRVGALVPVGVQACDSLLFGSFCIGGDDFKYQWYRGFSGDRNDPINNATQPSLFVSPGSTSFYWVEVRRDTADCKSASQSGTAIVNVLPEPKRRAVSHSFTNDTQDDLVWHNSATGQNEVWQMFGTQHQATIPLPPNPDAMQSIGDFNGDGKPDLVFRNPNTGANTVWMMQGTQLQNVATLAPRPGADWVIGAVADLDNDENHDVVWHNNKTGENEIWFQSGTDHAGTWALPSQPDGNWGLHGAADFNGDGKPDLFFHDRVTGQNSIWLMGDAKVATVADAGAGAQATARRRPKAIAQSVEAMPDTNWVPAQIVDLDGDGKPDIVWRNVVTGDDMVWFMTGVTHTGTAALETRPDQTWEIGGGGSTNSGPAAPETRAATTLTVTADPAQANTATVIAATLTANGAPVAGRTLTFKLNGIAVAQLVTDDQGSAAAGASVAGIAPGTYPGAATVSFDGDAQYAASTASADLTVTPARAIVHWSDPAPITYGALLSGAQLNATADVPGTFVYTPAAGTLPNAGHNLLTVTFTPADPSSAPVTKSVILVVSQAVATVSWNPPPAIAYGTPLTSIQLNATANVAGNFAYDPLAGTLLGLGAQTLHVTFTPSNFNYTTASASVTINVIQGSQSISWASPAPIVYGTPLGGAQLNAVVTASATAPIGAVTYDPPAGTILTAGTHTLTVTVAATPFYTAATKSVQIVVNPGTPIIAWPAPSAIVYGAPLSAAQLNATTTVAGSFQYTPAAGTILDAGNGQTLSVVFTPSDPNYTTVSAHVSIDVLKAKQTITWAAPAPIVYGVALSSTQLNASVSVVGPSAAGAITYTPAAGTILDAGSRTLTVNVAATPNYDAATTSVSLEVQKAKQTITWAAPAPIVYGVALSSTQLNASVSVVGPSAAGAVTYTPAAGTILDAGSRTLTVNVAATPNYDAATTSVSLEVQKAKQTLSWATPAPIVYGTPLSAAQLNANVSVVGPSPAGALVYAPASGIVLDAGVRTLTVTAQSTANYEAATLSVNLTVNRATLSLVVDPKSKLYGGAIPTLTGTLSGVVNGDAITPSYATPATQQSPAGVYPITGSLVDPAGRSSNYAVTITPSTLTVLPAPLQIAANPATTQYSDPLPQLTATFTGLVLGETPSNFAGALSITTTATQFSAPGTYPIAISGLTSPNYVIVYTGATLTVKQEDARVTITSPLLMSGDTVVLSATIKDISATADAAGDNAPGDIRKATITFVDRTSGATLCAAPIGLVQPGDERIAVATCSFTRAATTTSITVGARIGGYYLRDASAEDVTVVIVQPTSDSINGGGTAGGAKFNVNLQYDKNGLVKGNFGYNFERIENGTTHKYQLDASSIGSLAIRRTAGGGSAAFIGTGVLLDVTSPSSPIVLDTNAPLIVTATDGGEPSSHDGLAVTLLKKDGGYWLATGWDGTRAAELPLTEGNLNVH